MWKRLRVDIRAIDSSAVQVLPYVKTAVLFGDDVTLRSIPITEKALLADGMKAGGTELLEAMAYAVRWHDPGFSEETWRIAGILSDRLNGRIHRTDDVEQIKDAEFLLECLAGAVTQNWDWVSEQLTKEDRQLLLAEKLGLLSIVGKETFVVGPTTWNHVRDADGILQVIKGATLSHAIVATGEELPSDHWDLPPTASPSERAYARLRRREHVAGEHNLPIYASGSGFRQAADLTNRLTMQLWNRGDEDSCSFPFLTEPTEGFSTEASAEKQTALRIAHGLFTELPTFTSATIDEIADIRKALAPSLDRFRVALLRTAEGVRCLPSDDRFAEEADLIVRKEVAPPIDDLLEAVKTDAYLRRLWDKALGGGLAAPPIGASIALAATRVLGGSSDTATLVSSLAGAGVAGGAVAMQSFREWRREINSSPLLFYVELQKRLHKAVRPRRKK